VVSWTRRRKHLVVFLEDKEKLRRIREVRLELEEVAEDFGKVMKQILKEDRERRIEEKNKFESFLRRVAEAREEFREWCGNSVRKIERELQLLKELFKDDEEVLPRVEEWITRLEEIERGFESLERDTAEFFGKIFDTKYEELRRVFIYTGESLKSPLRLLAVIGLASELVSLSAEISAFLKGYEVLMDRGMLIV